MEVDILRHFTLRTSFGGEQYLNTYYWFGFKTYENSENNSTNEYNEGSSQSRSWTWTNQISYKNTFADKHNVSALAGVEAIDSWGRYMHAKRLGYFVDDPNFRSLNTGSGVQTNDGGPYARRKLFSVFAKALMLIMINTCLTQQLGVTDLLYSAQLTGMVYSPRFLPDGGFPTKIS
jgi:hypothetical protein